MTWEALREGISEEFYSVSQLWEVTLEAYVSSELARKAAWERDNRKFKKRVLTPTQRASKTAWERAKRRRISLGAQ